jgi:hypothetical protein
MIAFLLTARFSASRTFRAFSRLFGSFGSPAHGHAGPLAVLSLAAALRLWGLAQNGFGNEYYTAGMSSMSQSWHNFFYNSFDPAGFIAVDKPPVALWIQVASVKLFHFHPLAVLIPEGRCPRRSRRAPS